MSTRKSALCHEEASGETIVTIGKIQSIPNNLVVVSDRLPARSVTLKETWQISAPSVAQFSPPESPTDIVGSVAQSYTVHAKVSTLSLVTLYSHTSTPEPESKFVTSITKSSRCQEEASGEFMVVAGGAQSTLNSRDATLEILPARSVALKKTSHISSPSSAQYSTPEYPTVTVGSDAQS
ncbi:MAG: hypothetical protein BWY28_02734 [bacterium ADurb.Bin236]|nr:MAG: hypothetical protein BWY28_02734 [bacterium ADurb.Bin236]